MIKMALRISASQKFYKIEMVCCFLVQSRRIESEKISRGCYMDMKAI